MLRRFLNLFRPNRLDAEIREELEFHRGQTAGPFGRLAAIQEQTREASTIVWLETLAQDVRYGLRQLGRSPVFSLVAVLSLALGIGANTTIFTLINAVMLQNLPVKDPARLVLFYDGIDQGYVSGDRGFPSEYFSYASWRYFRDHNESFQTLSAFQQGSNRLGMHVQGSPATARPEQASGRLVSGSYFEVFGVTPAAGRLLTAADDAPAAAPAAVMSYRFWRRRFQLDRAVVGKVIDLNGTAFTVVGVAPGEFFGERVESPPDFWLPLAYQAQAMQRVSWLARQDYFWLNLVGRLKPGVTLPQAQAAVSTQLRQFYAAQAGAQLSPERQRELQSVQVMLKPGARGISSARFRYSEPLHLLMAVVALVLLIACANVATLLLARGAARRRELFARLALGASRMRLMRQLLTESVLLSLAGGAVGVAAAWWGVKLLTKVVQVSSVIAVKPDLLVLGFTLAVSILTGIAFGLVPALRASAIRIAPGERSADFGRPGLNPAHGLVVLQVAMSCVLLVGAGLLAHSLLMLERQDTGFRRENILLVSTDPRLAGYRPAELFPLYRQICDRLNALPGVVSATLASYSPISGSSSSGNISVEGYQPPEGKNMDSYGVGVGPRFFETLGMRLLLGRPIGPRDTPASPPVAVVNETFVRKFLPGQNPIGRRFRSGAPYRPPGIEIVGVVADSRYYKAGEKPRPMAFYSTWQGGGPDAYAGELLIRTRGEPSGAAAEVRKAIGQIDSRLTVQNVTTLQERVSESFHQERTMTALCGVFALLALLLASIGIYGTMAYSVARRTNEIGIRMALGAQRRGVLWMVLRQSVVLVVAGLAIGLPLAVGATRWIKSFLFGIPAVDLAGMGAAVALLAGVSLLAGYLPARRATKVDPLAALRYE